MKKSLKYIYDANPIYIHFKKHFCPICGNKTKVSYISKTINSKSADAINYDFSIGDTFLIGDVEFRTICFYCNCCDANISIKEMRAHEKYKK